MSDLAILAVKVVSFASEDLGSSTGLVLTKDGSSMADDRRLRCWFEVKAGWRISVFGDSIGAPMSFQWQQGCSQIDHDLMDEEGAMGLGAASS